MRELDVRTTVNQRRCCNIILYIVIMTIVLIIVLPEDANGKLNSDAKVTDSVLQFLQQNKQKYVTFLTLDTEELNVREQLQKLVKKSKLLLNIRSRALSQKQLESKHRFNQDTIVLVTTSTSENWKAYEDIIIATKIMSCVVICIGKSQMEAGQRMEMSLQEQSKNAFFYWIGANDEEFQIMDWKQGGCLIRDVVGTNRQA